MLKIIALKICFFTLFIVAVYANLYSVDDTAESGRIFDGIGGLSGGGATSKLLVNYPEPQQSQILDYLFKPNFGASLNILKVEIGGDSQSTDGTESSHMHEPWDENYQRGYEWWLMVEAKKRNPKISLYGLPWAFPGWVGTNNNPYTKPNVTATYIINWIKGAKKYYNLDMNYIGIWNERRYDITYIKTLRAQLDSNGLKSVRIVAADGGWGIANDILNSTSLANAVDFIGCHYPGTLTTQQAVKTGKQLWASEDYSTFNDNVGAGCWARILNQNYVNGYMTSTISWNLIAAYYMALPFGRDGLMTAIEPWSGHYVVESPIWVTAHTTQFVQVGWKYLQHGAGVGKFEKGGSYVSLKSPSGKDFTIIIETMSHNHSVCIRPALPKYTVSAQVVSFMLNGSLSFIKELHVWYSKLEFLNRTSTLFQYKGTMKVTEGKFTMNLDVDEIITLTTVTTGQKGSYGAPPASKEFPLPYFDNYDLYADDMEAYNFVPQVGVYEVRQSADAAHGKVNRQVMLNKAIDWCDSKENTINIGGNFNWTDVTVQVEVYIPSTNGSKGAFVAVRVDRGGCDAPKSQGLFLALSVTESKWLLTTDIALQKVVHSSSMQVKHDTWYRIAVSIKGEHVKLMVDDKIVLHAQVPNPSKHGFAGYGTMGFGLADFDNLHVTRAL